MFDFWFSLCRRVVTIAEADCFVVISIAARCPFRSYFVYLFPQMQFDLSVSSHHPQKPFFSCILFFFDKREGHFLSLWLLLWLDDWAMASRSKEKDGRSFSLRLWEKFLFDCLGGGGNGSLHLHTRLEEKEINSLKTWNNCSAGGKIMSNFIFKFIFFCSSRKFPLDIAHLLFCQSCKIIGCWFSVSCQSEEEEKAHATFQLCVNE